jgi:hypothetical protein
MHDNFIFISALLYVIHQQDDELQNSIRKEKVETVYKNKE